MAPSRKMPRASTTNIVTCPLSLRSPPLALLVRMVFMDVIFPPSQSALANRVPRRTPHPAPARHPLPQGERERTQPLSRGSLPSPLCGRGAGGEGCHSILHNAVRRVPSYRANSRSIRNTPLRRRPYRQGGPAQAKEGLIRVTHYDPNPVGSGVSAIEVAHVNAHAGRIMEA